MGELGAGASLATPQERAQSGLELRKREGLDEIVIRAAIQAADAILELIASRALSIRFLKALGPVAVGAAVYFLAARLLGLEEAQTLVRRLRR